MTDHVARILVPVPVRYTRHPGMKMSYILAVAAHQQDLLDVRDNWPEEVPQRAVSMCKYERKYIVSTCCLLS
jgi:hypothetical protein